MNTRILREVPEKRERYVKHFQMKEKGTAAAVYAVPVHYEENGNWQEIDNRLESAVQGGKRIYQNKASRVHVCFAEQAGDEKLVSVEKDGKELSWTMETASVMSERGDAKGSQGISTQRNVKAGSFQVLSEPEFPKNPEELRAEYNDEIQNSEENVNFEEDEIRDSESDEIFDNTDNEIRNSEIMESESGPGPEQELLLDETQIRQIMGVPHLASEGMYEDILPGVDLHYTIEGERIKENIRLKTKEAAGYPLKFHFKHNGMVMKKESDGSLGLYLEDQKREAAFKLEKPYMYDQNGEISEHVELLVESGDGESTLTIVPDSQWLMEESRAYPIVIDPRTETSKTRSNIEDTYIFPGGSKPENADLVYAFGSFLAGYSAENSNNRALLRFKNLPDIGKGSIIYGATMYIWQYQYNTYGVAKLPLLAQEVTKDWTEKTVRWHNQPTVNGTILDYKEVAQVKNGSSITITPIGFDVTRLVRQWYNTGKNYGIMVKSAYENDSTVANRAYARFYSSDHPTMVSDQYPSGVFYYRNVDGLEDYQSFHEQQAGRAGCGYTNDFNGNLVWIHPDTQTEGGPLTTEINHVYNSSAASVSSRLGYGWTLSCLQKLESTGITDYPYVYTDADGTKHYFYKDTADGGKLKDEDGLGLIITDSTGADYDHWKCIETKDKMKYTFGKDGYLRFDEDPDGNKVTYEYEPNSTQNYIPYITDPTGAKIEFVYKNDAALSRITAIKDTSGRLIQYMYDNAGNLSTITYPDGEKTTFTYDSGHRLLSVTNPEGYSISYQYTNDFRVPRISRITEKGSENQLGQEMKISYTNGNITTFEEPGLDGDIEQTADNQKTVYHFDNMGRLTDVLENDGYANCYSYYTSGMKNHKLGKEGTVQKTVYNLLKNPVFDSAYGLTDWYTYNLSENKKGTIITDQGYIGTKSAKLAKTTAESEEGIGQDVTLQPGTYTLSAYMKTADIKADSNGNTDGKGACLMVLLPDGTRIQSDRMLTEPTDSEVDGGWERISLTFTLAEQKTVTVFAGILGMTGTMYISGVQLEEGKAANKLNLLLNSGFETLSESAPANWTFSADVQGTKYKTDSTHGRCAVMAGRRDKALSCKQTVHVSGSEGDIYSLSCYVKGCGIPDKKFQLVAEVVYGNNDVKKHEFPCNPNINGWQFAGGVFSTDDGDNMTNKTYSAIHVYLQYDNQMNEVMIDGMQLTRDDGESYVYDGEGNLISAVSAAEKAQFTYDKKSSLTRMGGIEGTAFEYGYDSKKHLTNAANSEGVRYRFTYDEKGQPVGMTVEAGKHLAPVTPGRIYYIRDQYSGHYMEIQGKELSTPVLLQVFTGADNQKWKVIDCKDGYINLEPQNAPGTRLDLKRNAQNDGAVIQIYSHNNHDSQRWRLHPNQDGSYQLSSKGTNDKKGASNWAKSTEAGQAVLNYPLTEGNTFQNWHFEPTDEGSVSAVPEDGKVYYIRGRRSGQYVDVQGIGTASGTRAMQHYYNGGKNQQFRLTKYEGIYYYLEPLHAPGMVLAKSGTNSSGYPRLALEAKSDGKQNQLFWFDETEPGKGTGYAIVCKDGTALDVMNYSYDCNADIIMTAHTKVQDNKWWILEECSDRMEFSMEYTSDGRQIKKVTDARGNETNYAYDEKNQLLSKITDARGNETSYTYDPNTDRLTTVKRTVGGQEMQVEYTYDKDKPKTVKRNHGVTYQYGYDSYGNETEISVGGTVLEKTAYKNRNGLTDRVTYATGESIRNEYDDREQLISQYLVKKDGTEEKLFTNTYDNYGNVVCHVNHRNNQINHYQYDFIGRILGKDSSDGMRLRTVYDDKNRVKSCTYLVEGKGNTTEYIYGEAEKLQKPGLNYGVRINGKDCVDYIYDVLGRQDRQITRLSDTKTMEVEYTYVPGKEKGLTTTLIESVKTEDGTLYYSYDAAGNITEIWEKKRNESSKVRKVRYFYDELDQLIREDNRWQNQTIVYTYDAGSNITTCKTYAYTEADTVTGTAKTTETYTYGNSAWKDQLTEYRGQKIRYDAMGNPISYRGMTMEWEQGRKLKKITGNGVTQSHSYDADGIRIRKVVNGVTTQFYTNGTSILAQKSSDGTRLDFLYDDQGKLFAMEYEGERYFYKKNIQGDITGLVDKTGTEVVTYTYNTWGLLTGTTDRSGKGLAGKNPFRYREYYYDVELGLYYVSSRYYDPETRRFLNADDPDVLEIQSDLQDKNLYVYCDNNPVVRVDEDGAVWQLALAGGGTMATGSLVAGLGAITPAGWAAIIIGVVIIASIAIVKKRNSKLQIGNKLQICRTKNKTLYAKSKRKTGVDARGGHQKDKCKSKKNRHEKGDTRRKLDQGGSKARNKPNYKSRSNKRNR